MDKGYSVSAEVSISVRFASSHQPPSIFVFLSPWDLDMRPGVPVQETAEQAMRKALREWCFSLCHIVIPHRSRAQRIRASRVLAACMLSWYRARCATHLLELARGLGESTR